MNDQTPQKIEYELESVDLPRLSKLPVRLFVPLVESPLGRFLTPALFRDFGLAWLREREVHRPPTLYPIHHRAELSADPATLPQARWPGPSAESRNGFPFSTAHDYARAYREGTTNPDEVARAVLAAVARSDAADPPLGASSPSTRATCSARPARPPAALRAANP